MRLQRIAVAHGLLIAVLLQSACSAAPRPGPETEPVAGTAYPASAAADSEFRVVMGDTVLTGHLFDNATARDLAAQLPLTLTFRDLNDAEKTAPLPHKLAVDGMPPGDDPRVGDLGYWAPDGDLVMYYGDVGYWTGIMRIGTIDGDLQAVARRTGELVATVELVGPESS